MQKFIASDIAANITSTCEVTKTNVTGGGENFVVVQGIDSPTVITQGYTTPPDDFPACVHEIVSDVTYEIPWDSCTIQEVEIPNCTIYEIPWVSDC